MNIQQLGWNNQYGWDDVAYLTEANLVLVFGDTDFFYDDVCYQQLASFFPKAQIVGCSTAGNIRGAKVSSNDINVLAIQLKSSWIEAMKIDLETTESHENIILMALKDFPRDQLKHCLVISDGLDINAAELAQYLSLEMSDISITGGLAGDSDRFKRTGVMFNGVTKKNQVALIGLYGAIKVTSGFSTGWSEFGAERRVTRSDKNTVYEFDHEPALEVYQRYLGELADKLPISGLRFPLSVRRKEEENPLIRMLLGVNQDDNSLTFAGDIPEASYARLMKTNIDRLLESTQKRVAELKSQHLKNHGLCLVVSCVGRRLALDHISDEEIELIASELGNDFQLSGFYSYGEFASHNSLSCQLHNQTSTITLITEEADQLPTFFDSKADVHRLLRRQLNLVAQKDLDVETKWRSFLHLVNEDYLLADIERHLLENALDINANELATADTKFQLFINNAPAGIAMFDTKMNYLFASRRWLEDRKISSYEVIGNNHYEIFKGSEEHWGPLHLRCLNGEKINLDEDLVTLPDGSEAWLRWEMLPWRNSKDQIGGIIVLSENITKRKIAESELRIASVAFQSKDPMLVTDAKGLILKANEAFSLATGYSLDELIGNSPSLLRSEEHQDPSFYRNLWESILTEGSWEGKIWNRRKDGAVYPIWLSISAIRNLKNEISHFLAIYSNIRDPREAERKVLELAFYDPLTDLPNRRLLLDRLQQTHLSAVRSGKYGAILMIDLDNFKIINDVFGHDVGDAILVEVASCLRAALRESDTAARLGGDEFVILLTDLGSDLDGVGTSLKVVLDKLLTLLRQPKIINGVTHNLTASIGVSTFPNEDNDINALFKQSDIALYQSKTSGRNRISIFNKEMHDKFIERVNLGDRLKSAVNNYEFIIHYQPQVNFNGQLKGAEALLRWQTPDQELIPPMSFLPMAEENGLIIPIGYWALNAVCLQLAAWAENTKTAHLCIAINISALQFRQPDFSRQLKKILLETGANPHLLTLELTESVLSGDLDHVIKVITDLRTVGIRFSVDDFGTAFSSLSYLKRLPLDEIKIDKSFVTYLMSDSGDRAVIRSILSLAKSLSLDVTAEGIELPEQRDFLSAEGCDTFQGFLYGKPTNIKEFNLFIRDFSENSNAH